MGTFSYLATAAAEAASEGGIGFHFDILETNLVNLVIIIGLLIYFGRKFLGNILGQRRSNIESEIAEAENQAKQAAATLADAQQKLAQAQAEVEKIRKQAEERAQKTKEDIIAKAKQEVERIKEGAVQDVNAERERAINQLKQQVAALALEKVESQLKSHLSEDSAQRKLIDASIGQLGGGR